MPIARMLKTAAGAPARIEAPAPRTPAQTRQERRESEAEVATYIAQLTAEMGAMASAARLDLVAYFLSLAKMEAETVARRHIMEDLESP